MLELVHNDGWRCSYVLSPSTYTPLTPVIADLDHDGKLEVIYAFQFANEEIYFSLSASHSVFDLHVRTIENMMEPDIIDFSKFLPMESQSWTTYMGTKGNVTY